eukprot:CAMPEP_0198200290 /NCGR_PEP_ID=MMETSP1445-20131203/3329_1 /TAXON_ID=36898 /ORGANISM="Pyramimonas sp., Strain CCMP2087" /LENGTH=288 /DNA_ID=CAMNT_0043870305 /DNA_START=155 /DNA_END=1021 /DNA_ORIENTATION=-
MLQPEPELTASAAPAQVEDKEGGVQETGQQQGWIRYFVNVAWNVGSLPIYGGLYVLRGGKTSAEVEAAAEIEKEGNFQRKLAEMEDDDYSDIAALKLIETSGVDRFGRPVVWITGRHIPAVGLDLERIKWYMFSVLHEVAQQREFVIVYYHTEATWEENSPGVRWIRNAYEEIPMHFKQNLKRFLVVHPGIQMRTCMWVLGPWASGGFWDKLEYVDRVEFLWEDIDRSQCLIHKFIEEHDKELETQPLMDYGLYADPMQAAGLPEMSGGNLNYHGVGAGGYLPAGTRY